MEALIQKLSSRKFWVCVVVFFSSIATSIAALHSDSELVAAIGTGAGIIAAAASAVVYMNTEGNVDVARIEAAKTITTITASSTSKEIVQAALNQVEAPKPVEEKIVVEEV